MTYVDFFSDLGFDFNVDLKPKVIDIEKEATLSRKLKNSIFFYKSPNNTNTSFYLVTSSLETTELEQFRKYVWNKNDADIIFYYPNEADEVRMLYAKYSPKVSNNDSVLQVFSTTKKDLDTIEKIRHWQFDSGVFWLNYHSFIDKAKYKGIDKELVYTLKELKDQLSKLLIKSIYDDNKRNEVVQALIDRTLYIKYLEDNHIINSYFFSHYFNNDELNYEKLLENNSNTNINKLYKIIHELFNNALFDQPTIDDKYLTKEVRILIASSFNHNVISGQLRLFDFRFDVLPVEFISYIYEVFLSEKQKENGIYYTPKKLAQLIVDDVINEDKIGSILDPSSGSGMFLITGYQRLLEISQRQNLEPQDSIEKIKYRIQLLSENIFGVEKELTAQRFTLFSLSLQIFNGIDPKKVKEFIANELKENKKINLFSEYSFFQNIKHANTLNTSDKPFEDKVFSYIVGNPPFFEISNTEEFQNEISFLNSYQVAISADSKKVAKNIVGKSQISQCFFLKIKDWSKENTRFGFVSNSSNFYNDYSEVFQEYFYSHYGIEKIYELSRVKKILFEKAKESVVAIIFTNNLEDSIIDYYPVDLGLFSEKPFELLIIQEDKAIEIAQSDLVHREIRLRDFLVGNEYDNLLIKKLSNSNSLQEYILKNDDFFLHRGIQLVGFEEMEKEFGIKKERWKSLTQKQRDDYYVAFKSLYSSQEQTNDFPIPFIKPSNIEKFKTKSYSSYLGSDISMFHRPRNKELYLGQRIVWSRIGKSLKAVYLDKYIYFDFDLYVLKLENESYYHLIVAILNSDLINYFSNIHLKKRIDSSFPKIGMDDIKKIPVPIDLDNELVTKVSDLSKHLSEGKYEYTEKEPQLNELIFDLYELSFWEKQRIKDYFLPKSRIGRKKKALDSYKNTLKEIVRFYFESPITIDEAPAGFNLIVVKISFDNGSNSPKVANTKNYLLNEIFEQNPNANFLASQEKIFGKDCVYIIKEDINKNWTETKAFEDGHDILKHLIPNENGERIH
ncbi:TaqI-like C-terminal specificity domain-containing protein [Litoribacter populi]|uniref:TaqI-like C-terminal specificity domain-containing protein n=1 Tax=Litoribacter populi TaxID=2598460 RepID=UPI00117C2248|nr:TaqI-like C-terminal specificity domain-containing protein [Litoribacter populi]